MKRKIICSVFLITFIFISIPIFAQNNQPHRKPEKGYTKKATNLYSEPSVQSTVISKLPISQKIDIETISNDNQFYYVEIDKHGPDIHGWVLVKDIQVYEYDHDDDD